MLDKFDDDYEVCSCMNIDLKKVIEVVRAGSLTTVEEVMQECEAGTACEQCQCIKKSGGDKELHLNEIVASLQK